MPVVIITLLTGSLFSQQNLPAYPLSKTVEQVDNYFNYKIEDPYLWLENQQSEETKAWVKEQNNFTQNFLNSVSKTYNLRERIRSNTEFYFSTPKHTGGYYFKIRPATQGKELSILYKRNLKPTSGRSCLLLKD